MKTLLSLLSVIFSLIVLAGIPVSATQQWSPYTYYPTNTYTYYPSNYYTPVAPVYPGCSAPDIIIGGQIWASCNALTKNTGNTNKSWWFFARDTRASFYSYNGRGAPLEWQGKTRPQNTPWITGPCAPGYRIPSRWDWETILYYARLNGSSVTTILNLPRNGWFRGYKDSDGDVRIESEQDIAWAYWSSSVEYGNNQSFPIVMRINAPYQANRMDGTYYSDTESWYDWQYSDAGLSLVAGTASDLANVRCIKK
jgi:hypothetical protein